MYAKNIIITYRYNISETRKKYVDDDNEMAKISTYLKNKLSELISPENVFLLLLGMKTDDLKINKLGKNRDIELRILLCLYSRMRIEYSDLRVTYGYGINTFSDVKYTRKPYVSAKEIINEYKSIKYIIDPENLSENLEKLKGKKLTNDEKKEKKSKESYKDKINNLFDNRFKDLKEHISDYLREYINGYIRNSFKNYIDNSLKSITSIKNEILSEIEDLKKSTNIELSEKTTNLFKNNINIIFEKIKNIEGKIDYVISNSQKDKSIDLLKNNIEDISSIKGILVDFYNTQKIIENNFEGISMFNLTIEELFNKIEQKENYIIEKIEDLIKSNNEIKNYSQYINNQNNELMIYIQQNRGLNGKFMGEIQTNLNGIVETIKATSNENIRGLTYVIHNQEKDLMYKNAIKYMEELFLKLNQQNQYNNYEFLKNYIWEEYQKWGASKYGDLNNIELINDDVNNYIQSNIKKIPINNNQNYNNISNNNLNYANNCISHDNNIQNT